MVGRLEKTETQGTPPGGKKNQPAVMIRVELKGLPVCGREKGGRVFPTFRPLAVT